jgi:MFS family permease
MLPSYFVIKEMDSIKNAKAKGEPGPRLSWRTFLASPIPAVFSAQFLVNVARGGVENGGVLFLYAAYAYDPDASVAVLGVLSSVMAGVSIPIALASGIVMDKHGRKFTLVPGTVSLTIALLMMAATAYADLSFIWFIGAFAANHIAVSMMLGSWQTIGTDVAPKEGRGTFFGTSRLISHTGRLSSPGSFAILSEVGSFGIAFTFLAAASLAAGGIIMFLVKETLHLQDATATPIDREDPTAAR